MATGSKIGRRERLNTQELTAYRAFITAHALIIERIEHEMTAAGVIPLMWYDVLIELYEAPGRQLRQYELAHAVVLSKSNISRLVDRLEVAGLLTRERCETDKRGAYVVLTETGIEAMRRAWPVYARGIRANFANYITEDDAGSLAATFERINAALRHSDDDADRRAPL